MPDDDRLNLVALVSHFAEEWTWLFDKMRADADLAADGFRQIAEALTEAPTGEE